MYNPWSVTCYSHISCMYQQRPNQWRKAMDMLALCEYIYKINCENNMCFSVKGSTHNLFSLAVCFKTLQWITFLWHLSFIFLVLHSSASLKKHHQLSIQNMHISLKMFHPVGPPMAWRNEISAWSYLLWANVLLLWNRWHFPYFGAIISRHGGCLAKPQINNWALCKWTLGTAMWPLVLVEGDGGAVGPSRAPVFAFHQH